MGTNERAERDAPFEQAAGSSSGDAGGQSGGTDESRKSRSVSGVFKWEAARYLFARPVVAIRTTVLGNSTRPAEPGGVGFVKGFALNCNSVNLSESQAIPTETFVVHAQRFQSVANGTQDATS